MREVILLDPDPETRLLLRSLLERDGFAVSEAQDPNHAMDVIRASAAAQMVIAPSVSEQYPQVAQHLGQIRPNMDILTPSSYGGALLDGAAGGEGLSEFARDAMLLLSILAEEGARRPQAAEKIGRMTELTSIRMELSRRHVELCSAAAALVALGPSLVAFRFGVDPEGGASGGLSKDLQAALAAFGALRCPFDLRPVIEAVEERWDGRGRPQGLAGDQIPLGARIVAVTRDFCNEVAGGADEIAATELIRSRANSDYDPRVVEAFFRALRDESYLSRLEGGQQGARILIADGDSASLSVTEMRLGAAGFAVSTCQDGAKAFELVQQDPPDVLIADTVLPKLDGISLLLKMRRSPQLKGLPVIFVSSRTDPGLLNKALKLGAKDVLAKPVNYDVLLAKLRTLSTMKQGQVKQQAGAALQGNLAEMPLTDFFQVLAIGRKTCKVSIASPAGKAEVFFEQGSPVAAFTQQERGREAFATVVTWNQGSFGITLGETAPEHNLDKGLEAMLLQGTQLGQ